jgi:hypothetical protein
MSKFKPILLACIAIALLAPVVASADQLAKRGSYSGRYLWTERAKVVEVDKGWMFTDAVQQGVFLNSNGSGFLHGATAVCTSQGVIQNDQFWFSGNCAATDKDGDKAVLKWACSKAGNRCAGAFDWMGGTGKYAGMRGQSQFDGGVLGQGPLGTMGDSNWKGEWALP